MTKPVPDGSRAPRCRLLSQPRRRPWPHSAARTTRSSVWRGLTFSHPAPRRPAAYGASSDLTRTPSWPAGRAASRKARASAASAISARGTRLAAGTSASRAAARSTPGRSMRSSPSTCSTSKKSGVSGAVASARRVPKRLAVTWKGYGRPSGFSAIASPSRTTSPAGSARTASTTSGTRAVMSSRLRVKARTSAPRRWTCRRAPSSLYSMAAGPVFASAPSTSSPGAASIGWIGRPTSRPTARSASTPPSRAAAAVVPGGREHGVDRAPALEADRAERLDAAPEGRGRRRAGVAAEHARPADRVAGHLGGPRHRLHHDALLGALAQLARQQRDEEALLGLGRAREERGQRVAARRLRPGASHRADRLARRVDLHQRKTGLDGGRGQVPQRAVADPDLALAQLARQVGHGDRHLSRPRSAQRLGQAGDLLVARAGLAHGLGGGGQLGQQHRSIVPRARPVTADAPACVSNALAFVGSAVSSAHDDWVGAGRRHEALEAVGPARRAAVAPRPAPRRRAEGAAAGHVARCR